MGDLGEHYFLRKVVHATGRVLDPTRSTRLVVMSCERRAVDLPRQPTAGSLADLNPCERTTST